MGHHAERASRPRPRSGRSPGRTEGSAPAPRPPCPPPLGPIAGAGWGSRSGGPDDRMGCLLAQETLAEVAERGGLDLQLLVVSTPNQEVLERAVQRLVALEEVVVLLGGIGQGQAEALGRLASQLGVLFVNLGDASPPLRKGNPLALHVEAELGSYLLGLRALTRRLGSSAPFSSAVSLTFGFGPKGFGRVQEGLGWRGRKIPSTRAPWQRRKGKDGMP
jgi:hypothetical protein